MEIHSDLEEKQWLKLRHKNINSTESPALFGLSPYMTEFELYHRKQDPEPYSIADSFRMKAGRMLEPVIAQMVLDDISADGEPFKYYLVIPVTRMGSSFDWIVTSGKYKGWLIECKNVDYLQWRDKWADEEAPVHIETQVQHQMHVKQAPGTIISALVGGNELKTIFRTRDERVGMALEKRVSQFWQDVEKQNEPEPNFQRDADIVKQLHGSAEKGKVYDASDNPHIGSLLAQYREWGQEIDRLKAMRESVKAEVYSMAGEASKVVGPDGFSVSCGMTKASEGRLVTPDMVGQRIGGRGAFRQFRVNAPKG